MSKKTKFESKKHAHNTLFHLKYLYDSCTQIHKGSRKGCLLWLDVFTTEEAPVRFKSQKIKRHNANWLLAMMGIWLNQKLCYNMVAWYGFPVYWGKIAVIQVNYSLQYIQPNALLIICSSHFVSGIKCEEKAITE